MDDHTYEGRRLPHQDEPLADQGLQFDLATLTSHRRALAALGTGAAVLGLAACGSDAAEETVTSAASDGGGGGTDSASGEIPEETNGPYPADGTNGVNVLTESGIVREDITASFGTSTTVAPGVPMTLTLQITDLSSDNAPYDGVAVYVWHCNAAGEYSLYSEGLEQENYLRGVQVAGADGSVTFTSIFPACYAGRWPHVHFEVYPDADSITSTDELLATSQVALPQAVCEDVYALVEYAGSAENLAQVSLEGDNVFGDDGGELQLAAVEGDATSGFVVTLPVAIDPTTQPGASGGMGGTPPSGGGGAGGPAAGRPGTPPEGAPDGAPSDGGAESAAYTGGESTLVGNALVSSR